MQQSSFYVATNCCAVQRNETYRIAKFFKLNGWKELSSPEDSDINIVTTCGVTNITEKDAFRLVEEIYKKQKTNAVLVISGCLPNICLSTLSDAFPTARCIPLDKLDMFDELICADIKISDVFYNSEPELHHSSGDPTLDSNIYSHELAAFQRISEVFFSKRILENYNYCTQGRYLWKDDSFFEIKISSGCSFHCSYCVSRKGIGAYRSKPLDRIEQELQIGIAKGYKRIMLMGDELGGYGHDIGLSLIDVLTICKRMGPDVKIGIRYIHPDFLIELYPKLKPFMSNIFFVCVSLQSGSPKVLRTMNRRDNVSEICNIIKEVSCLFPQVYLHTQIIVGFPTEEEEDFQKTLKMLHECRFDYIRVNRFSAREGTTAFGLPTVCSYEEIENRMNYIQEFCRYNRIERIYSRMISEIGRADEEQI